MNVDDNHNEKQFKNTQRNSNTPATSAQETKDILCQDLKRW
jgi:hypothetical protein